VNRCAALADAAPVSFWLDDPADPRPTPRWQGPSAPVRASARSSISRSTDGWSRLPATPDWGVSAARRDAPAPRPGCRPTGDRRSPHR
jgi:hypothetical protein